MIKHYFLALILLSSVSGLKGKESFNQLDISNGLSNNTIWSIEKGPQGFIWFGTSDGLSRFNGYDFDNFYLESAYSRSLHLDKRQSLWVGADKGLVFKLVNGDFVKYKLGSSLNLVRNIVSDSQGIWALTEDNIYYKPYEARDFSSAKLSSGKNSEIKKINSVFIYDDQLMLSTDKGLYQYSNNKLKLYDSINLAYNINQVAVLNDRWLINTPNETFYYLNKKKQKSNSLDSLSGKVIRTIKSSGDTAWIGTLKSGLYKVKNNEVEHYSNSSLESNTESVINSIYLDKNMLWIGTFFKGIHYKDLSSEKLSSISKPIINACKIKDKVYSIYQRKKSTYLSIPNRLLVIDNATNECKSIEIPEANPTFDKSIYQMLSLEDQSIWIASSQGLFELRNHQLIHHNFSKAPLIVFSILEIEQNKLLLATNSGAFIYDKALQSVNRLAGSKALNNSIIHKLSSNRKHVFALTDIGLAIVNKKTIELLAPNNPILSKEVNAISMGMNNFHVAASDNYLYQFSYDGQQLNKRLITHAKKKLMPIGILKNKTHNEFWISTYEGLYRVSATNSKTKRYIVEDGLSSNFNLRHSNYQNDQGALFFGNEKSFNAFYPEDIKDNLVPPKVALTKLTRFNEEVVVGEDYEGFSIESPIEYLDELEIGHRDYVMGFEFAGLHFADPMRNQYQYKLEGFHEDWVSTDAKNRTATFTNLSPGDYVFRVRAANKDGIWSLEEDNVALKITVHPAPWLSWWAFTLYGLIVLGSILWFIRYRTQAAIARSRELELEVASRTKEIATQKNVIESLLERKNELFANISHEFRTPLTLILGPLEKELKALDSPKNPKHLQMIQRNATRLLGMVEQILKLTELKKEDTVNKVPHAVNPALEAIVESFGSLAESKQIALSLSLDKDANVMAANDALEVMVGNLVSNAIKYTPEGGQVFVQSKLLDNTIQIQVTDTGVGMTKAQQDDVFERFVRLDKTSDIAGTGIGLSIVKELILAHNGQVQVESVDGQGSTFTISLPTTEQAALSDTHSIKSIEHLTQGETATASEVTQTSEESLTNAQQELVLIIDDNPDMRDYIQEVLAPNYHCITADRGEAGIELAKAQVPDLIICDIMMPGIDGYEVAKRLRDDIITSHIPLVLLTAKGDKESRIQGWNENIDDYMTKPFDEEELKARIGNILSLRALIKSSPKFDKAKTEDNVQPLTDKDKAFIQKLDTVLEKHYQNPLCNRSDIASDMAVSERQLQRKLKGLINQNPMDYLRGYRLEKAAKMLPSGKPINLISDLCGFNSASHFTQCFKAKFGITPKNYK